MTTLHAEAINFEQAASLVIGAAVGTTVTGALAAIGGSVPAKRTAAALADLRRAARPLVIEQTAGGRSDPAHTLAMLDAMRWLDRVGYHTWCICNYLGSDGKPERSPTDARTNHDE